MQDDGIDDALVDLDPELNQLTRAVIGAAIEVHRILGPGFLESVYQKALAVELRLRGIPASAQHRVELFYKGESVGEGFLDPGNLVPEGNPSQAWRTSQL